MQHTEPGDAAAAERQRLVRLCAFLSGSEEAAEDLAQETLVEAWRHDRALRDPERRSAWVSGIARNVCKRWLRERGRAAARLVGAAQDDGQGNGLDALIGDTDLEIDLERGELAALLDRAMALLSPETRDILIERFINDLSHAEIAQQLRLSEGTVKVRVHRGKLALRRVLTTHFADDLHVYGFAVHADGWRETRVWCASCGKRTLHMSVTASDDGIDFRCPDCDPESIAVSFSLANPRFAALVGGLTRPAVILRRGWEWLFPYFSQVDVGGSVPCTRCGQSVTVKTYVREEDFWPDGQRCGLYVSCDRCGEELCSSRNGLVLAMPDVLRFRREHPRIRLLSLQEIEADGLPALVTRVQSVTSEVALDVVTDADTYRVLRVHRASGPGAGP